MSKNPMRKYSDHHKSPHMDARKHLRGLGWGGEGHALGKNADGIKKPLLIKHKRNLHGLGAKSQKEKQADQWWLNAFDNALKDIGSGKESSLAQVREHGGKGGLYGFFVRGKGLDGTIGDDSSVSGTSTPTETTTTVTTTVTLSVKDLAQAPKKSKKEKKSKDKKRKREEDPVDSHQDEPEDKKSRPTSTETSEDGSLSSRKKRKKNKKDRKKSEFEPGVDEEQTTSATIDVPLEKILENAPPMTDKEERRKAKAEKRARKEAKRKLRESSMVLKQKTDKEERRKNKANWLMATSPNDQTESDKRTTSAG